MRQANMISSRLYGISNLFRLPRIAYWDRHFCSLIRFSYWHCWIDTINCWSSRIQRFKRTDGSSCCHVGWRSRSIVKHEQAFRILIHSTGGPTAYFIPVFWEQEGYLAQPYDDGRCVRTIVIFLSKAFSSLYCHHLRSNARMSNFLHESFSAVPSLIQNE